MFLGNFSFYYLFAIFCTYICLNNTVINYKERNEKLRKKFMGDGKLDNKELFFMIEALILGISDLGEGVRDVYQAVSRIETKLNQLGGRGPLGR